MRFRNALNPNALGLEVTKHTLEPHHLFVSVFRPREHKYLGHAKLPEIMRTVLNREQVTALVYELNKWLDAPATQIEPPSLYEGTIV